MVAALRGWLSDMRGWRRRSGHQLAPLVRQALTALVELSLEGLELDLAPLHELQQRVRVRRRLAQKPLALDRIGALLPRPPALDTRRLAGQHLAQLVERETQEPLQPQQLAQPLDVGLVVLPMLTRRPRVRGGKQPDLLVVADGPDRRRRGLRECPDPHLL